MQLNGILTQLNSGFKELQTLRFNIHNFSLAFKNNLDIFCFVQSEQPKTNRIHLQLKKLLCVGTIIKTAVTIFFFALMFLILPQYARI